MSNRSESLAEFLVNSGWGNAEQTHLAGDASNRSYLRLCKKEVGETAVLMDASPTSGENIHPFITMTNHLLKLGLSAPLLLAQNNDQGFLLIEDLGDALFARVVMNAPDQEVALYSAAVDVLIELHGHKPLDGVVDYAPSVMAQYIAPVFEWYQPLAAGKKNRGNAAITAELEAVLTKFCTGQRVLALRDYHAENLLWLPEREGIRRVGLLDYQDAVKAHASYDLVSLLEDARRDVPAEIQTEMLNRYIAATRVDPDSFRAAYNANGAQRNLRILGIFTRLCVNNGKADYVDLIPRVWDHLKHDLAHPELSSLRDLVFNILPAPSPEILKRIKSKCAKSPTP